MGLNEANKKTWVKEIMIYQVSNASSGCVLSTTQLETRTNTQFFWQASAPSHTSLMFRNKYLRMLPGSQIVSWKPDVIYTSFWCRLILHYIEVVRGKDTL